jgi:quinol monooxygenase YgiN
MPWNLSVPTCDSEAPPCLPSMVYTLTVHLYANDHPESVSRIKAKLIEAARIYRKDKETVDWLVMQDVHNPRAFTIVERFENEGVR